MFQSPIEEIKNKLDIVDVVSGYIKLQKAGANLRACCPFHSEKKPSFFVSPARQIWHCFGCQKGGDIFGFVKEIEGVEFGDALRILAQKAGIELKKERPELKTERNRLHDVLELSCRFFEKQLAESSVGKEAREYLLGRGISEDSIKKWRLGYAPDIWQGLSDFLASQGFQKDEISRAGLALASEQGSFYDRFRGRITFPIFDLNSQAVGFGGRVFKNKDKNEVAKYMNTSNTLLYDKSRILYGLDKAKVEIRKKNACILVEGYTDCIMAHQAGTQNVVATSGTALTFFQLKILKRYTENLVLGFDMDIAGETATKRGIDLAQSQGFNIKVLRLPEGKDAAEIIAKNLPDRQAGEKEWRESQENPKSILEFYFEAAFKGRNPDDPEGKKEISKILLPVIKIIPNQIERSFWIQKLAANLKVKEADVRQELEKVKSETRGEVEKEEIINLPLKSRRELLEERLLTIILKSPQSINLVEGEISYFSPNIRDILSELKKTGEKAFSPELKVYLDCLSLKAETEEIEEKEITPEIQFCLKEIKKTEDQIKLNAISGELKKAEEDKNFSKSDELSKEFNQLTKTLNG